MPSTTPPCSGTTFPVGTTGTKLWLCTDNIVRVTHAPAGSTGALPTKTGLVVLPTTAPVQAHSGTSGGVLTVTTASLKITANTTSGDVSVFDASTGNALLEETGHSLTKTPNPPLTTTTYDVMQQWKATLGESLYGGGEYQNGLVDWATAPLNMVQFNTEAIVPFFVSTAGYGILWDHYAWSYLNQADMSGDPALTRINFTTAEAAPSPTPLPNGTPLALLACDMSDFRQQWHYDPSSGNQALTLMHEPSGHMVVDANSKGGAGKPPYEPHLWQRDASFDYNQLWELSFSASALVATSIALKADSQYCLAASSTTPPAVVNVSACHSADSDGTADAWTYNPGTGQVALSGTQSCLAASKTAPLPSHTASFTPSATGEHTFYIECADDFGTGMGKTLRLYIAAATAADDTVTVVDWEQLTNLPDATIGRATLTAGTAYTVSLEYDGWSGSTKPEVFVRPPNTGTKSLRAIRGDFIDYYVVGTKPAAQGDSSGACGAAAAPAAAAAAAAAVGAGLTGIDASIANYRQLTGAAPPYGKFAYGFWQCKEHYHNQTELLNAAHGFRDRQIPLDAIVQDWHYWGDLGWGPQWDPKVYPDPAGMVSELHGMHMALMVSVWSKFDTTTTFFKNMTAQGYMINGTNYYDPYNAAARDQFYQFIKSAMFDIGVDAIWADATEPEGFPNEGRMVALGTGDEFMNPYSLMTTKAIADGLRRDFSGAQGRRVFTLTRSAFAGQQRTGAALWSGDISGKWDSLRRQVAASINYQMSGIPYWSEDIGGFFRPSDQYSSDDYHDMLTRWFQFGAFTPIFRVHGGGSNTELWNYGNATMNTIVDSAINLRYRFLPYNYAGFAGVYQRGTTMQRGLAFDFPADPAARQVADQFMWGRSVMVAPIVTPADAPDGSSTGRSVYLPATAGGWWDFYSGTQVVQGSSGGKGTTLDVRVPRNQSSLHVAGGSVVPLGPLLQFVSEKPADPIEVRVYTGADGSFELLEDDGVSAGTFGADTTTWSSITLAWSEADKALTIGARVGSYPGMPATASA